MHCTHILTCCHHLALNRRHAGAHVHASLPVSKGTTRVNLVLFLAVASVFPEWSRLDNVVQTLVLDFLDRRSLLGRCARVIAVLSEYLCIFWTAARCCVGFCARVTAAARAIRSCDLSVQASVTNAMRVALTFVRAVSRTVVNMHGSVHF
jgi:hypothetical protein